MQYEINRTLFIVPQYISLIELTPLELLLSFISNSLCYLSFGTICNTLLLCLQCIIGFLKAHYDIRKVLINLSQDIFYLMKNVCLNVFLTPVIL